MEKVSGCPDESEYLFQLKNGSKDLVVFSIPQKKFTTFELEFKTPRFPGSCHIKNEFYFAGGFYVDE